MTPRQAARAAGEARYTGGACRACRGTVRYVCNKACVVCEAERQRALYTDDEFRERIKADRRARYDAMTCFEYHRRLLQLRRNKALHRMAERNRNLGRGEEVRTL